MLSFAQNFTEVAFFGDKVIIYLKRSIQRYAHTRKQFNKSVITNVVHREILKSTVL